MSIHSLGYITVQSTDLTRWADYGTQVVGFAVNDALTQANSDKLYLKMDDRPYRFLVEKADADRYRPPSNNCALPASKSRRAAPLKSPRAKCRT
jgi:hypothetical protein